MTLKQLQYLVKIVECGSLTQASRQLSVSQPSITKAIASLEEEYHIRLLERHAYGVQMTEEGQRFLHYARSVLTAVETLEASVSGEQPGKRQLTVAAQQLDFTYSLMGKCYEKIPPKSELFFNLIEADRAEVVRQVLAGETDLGLIVQSSDDPKYNLYTVEAKHLDVFEIDCGGAYIACGPKCPLYERESVEIDEALTMGQVALDMEAQAKEAFRSNREIYRFFRGGRMIFCNTVSAAEYCLQQSAAVCFVSPWTRGCFQNPEIRILPVNGTEGANHLLWLRRAGEALSRTELRFLKLLYDFLRKPLPQELI